jgi:predicted  nucleic acid-binding Zn-ribbon protein
MVLDWITIDQELAEAGFNNTARRLMHEVCEKYGGVAETLRAVNEFNDLGEIQLELWRLETEVKRLRSEVDRLNSVKEELDNDIDQRRVMINMVNAALLAGFDTLSLSIISEVSKNLGGPYKVVNAIKNYGSLKEMNKELEAKKAELENVKKETSDKTQYLNALNFTLKEAKEEYNRNKDVRMVVELLINPRGIKMDRPVVVRLLTRVLESSVQRIEENPEIIPIPSAEWDATYENVKRLADRLRPFSE